MDQILQHLQDKLAYHKKEIDYHAIKAKETIKEIEDLLKQEESKREKNAMESVKNAPIPPNKIMKRKYKKKPKLFFGVYGRKSGKFEAQVYKERKKYYLGVFENQKDAARKVDQFIIENGLNPIRLNFPENIEKYNEKNGTSHPNYSIKVKSDAGEMKFGL